LSTQRQQLPELDGALASNLRHPGGSDLDRVTALIARYAAPAILPQFEAFYESVEADRRACLVSALGYMLRVEPAAAVDTMRDALTSAKPQGCKTVLFKQSSVSCKGKSSQGRRHVT